MTTINASGLLFTGSPSLYHTGDGVITVGSGKLSQASPPTNGDDLVNKTYVDDVVSKGQPHFFPHRVRNDLSRETINALYYQDGTLAVDLTTALVNQIRADTHYYWIALQNSNYVYVVEPNNFVVKHVIATGVTTISLMCDGYRMWVSGSDATSAGRSEPYDLNSYTLIGPLVKTFSTHVVAAHFFKNISTLVWLHTDAVVSQRIVGDVYGELYTKSASETGTGGAPRISESNALSNELLVSWGGNNNTNIAAAYQISPLSAPTHVINYNVGNNRRIMGLLFDGNTRYLALSFENNGATSLTSLHVSYIVKDIFTQAGAFGMGMASYKNETYLLFNYGKDVPGNTTQIATLSGATYKNNNVAATGLVQFVPNAASSLAGHNHGCLWFDGEYLLGWRAATSSTVPAITRVRML